MGMKKKKKQQRQKAERQRKRMRRPARLANARPWLATHQGADVLHDYQCWYGVDPLCAVAELRLLGVPISEEREAQVREDVEQRAKARAAKRAKSKQSKQSKQSKRAKRAKQAEARAARRAEASRPTSWAEAHIDWLIEHGGIDDHGDASAGNGERRLVDLELFEGGYDLGLKIIETKVEYDDETLNIWMRLAGDPAVLAKRGWGLIYAISVLSFTGADAELDFADRDEWTVADMLRNLSFERGCLRFHAGRVRGRSMNTTIEIEPEGRITIGTTNRDDAAMQWIARLQGKDAMPEVNEEPPPWLDEEPPPWLDEAPPPWLDEAPPPWVDEAPLPF